MSALRGSRSAASLSAAIAPFQSSATSASLPAAKSGSSCAQSASDPIDPMVDDAKLPSKGHAFLSPRLFATRRLCRQLQHGCLLAFAQEGQKKSLPIRQLERVMVHVRLFTIDLAKNCRLVPSGGGSAIDCDFRIEGKLRAGKHADRGAGVARSGKSTRAGAEITRSKLVANARGTRFDVHQAIVAHGIGSSVPHLLRLTRGADHGSLDGPPLCRAPNTWS